MNRSRSVSETSVGLFAFLDVLMSTMGSLILVLMVVTPKIRQEAVVKAAVEAEHAAETRHAVEVRVPDEKAAPPYVPPYVIELPRETVDLNAKLKVELAELSQQTQDRQRETDAKREALSTAQSALQKNQLELEELEKRLEQILRAKARMAEAVTKVSSEGVAVESQLAKTDARLRTLHGQIAHTSTMYTFVAYDGVTGTTRRPILIECTREHIKFLQENVTLSSTDVSGYSPSYNPVQAGAQALVDYWSAHSAPNDPRPYVLLVVRPSGAIAYGMARRLLERMKDPFGYELLPDDQQLDVPPAVPEAAEACRKAVEKAISNRVDIFKEVFGNGLQSGRNGLLAGSGTDSAGHSRTKTGVPTSPFDDLGDGLLGDSKHASQNSGNAAGNGQSGQPDGSNAQPGGKGTNGGSLVAQSDSNASGTGSAKAGPPGGTTSGTSGTDSLKSGSPTPGTSSSGSALSGDRQAGMLLSDTGPLATDRTAGAPGGPSLLGIGTPGTDKSSAGGLGSSGVNAGLPGPDGTGVGLSANGLAQGNGPGGKPPDSGSQGNGSQATGYHGSLAGGTGSPGSLMPGADSQQAGTARLGGSNETGAQGPVDSAAPIQSQFPAPLVPGSSAGQSSTFGANSDQLMIAHPTPGAGSAGTSDGQSGPQTGQSGGGLETGSAAAGPQSGTPQADPDDAPSGQAGSGGAAPADLQSSQSGMPPMGSPGQPQSGQPQSSQPGGSPSMGSPSSGGSDGQEGPSAPDSDAPPNSKSVDGLPNFATSSVDDDRPRRSNQQAVQHWGISSPKSNIGYEHDVMVYIEAQRIFVGNQPPINCGKRETSDQLSRAFVRALNKEARTWGRPREGFYWVPSLKIVICAGGIVPYERIQSVILRHDLNSTVDFRLELSRPAPLPRLVTN